MILWLASIFLVGLICWFVLKSQRYWANKGLPQTDPLPLFGDMHIFGSRSLAQKIKDVYDQHEGKRCIGFYQFILPTLLLKDPELIKQITVKDFDYFTDHRSVIPENTEILWARNLFALTGNKWREMRATLSPSFTSSKMKLIYGLISDCAKSLTIYFEKHEEERKLLEMKDLCSRFANDVIASTAFGINCDSFGEKKNDFYLMGKEATNFSSLTRNLKIFISLIFPMSGKWIGLRMFSERVSTFFTNIIKETIKIREEKNIIRPDMIHLLMEARKGKSKQDEAVNVNEGFAVVEESQVGKVKVPNKEELTDVDITAQALIFFTAGFDTVSSAMTFMSYELAVNPDIQKRLQKEIDDAVRKCNGSLTYEALMKMEYMDMVLSETLRLWPPIIGIDRLCVKNYTFESSNGKQVTLNVGDVVMLPIYPIQRDPQYYPNPERFDPERFSNENKDKIVPYTYLPFGSGPRGCIGSRFALMEVKTIFSHLLRKFDIVVTKKTDIPFRLSKKQFTLASENGVWLGLKLRNVE